MLRGLDAFCCIQTDIQEDRSSSVYFVEEKG